MCKTCFCSVIFDKNLPYFSSFLKSLEKQSDKNFVLLLFNDGIQGIDEYLISYDITYEVINVSGTPNGIRHQMLSFLRESCFENTIFGDTDDFFPENRVAVNKKLLETNDIVINDLWLVTEEEKPLSFNYWSNREELQVEINLESIYEYNFIGLGNTAIQNNKIPKNIHFDDEIKAVDWLFFSRMLFEPKRVIFTSDTYIFYRQHINNSVGLRKITLLKFKQDFETKLKHYTILAEEDNRFVNKAETYISFKETINNLQKDEFLFYIKEINHPFWWEEIQL